MTVAETVTARNAAFAEDGFTSGLRMMPSLRTIVIGCVDPRVDPADVLGLAAGEAAILRNVGGRVTAETLMELALLRAVTQAAGGDLGAGWEIIVLHHTDCGIIRLEDKPEMLSAYFDVTPDALPARAVADPKAAVALDMAALRDDPDLGAGLVVSGLVYDVATGLVEVIASG